MEHEHHKHNEEHHDHGHDHGGHGHHDHHAHMIEDFKKRFWISLVLSVPVVILSPMIQSFLGFTLEVPYAQYITFALSTVLFFYGGWPFLKGLVEEVGQKQPGMMTLIAVAITVAYVYSSATVFGLEGKDFFWELATLIDIMLLGHWIEMRSVMGASKALKMLVEMMPSEAHLVKDDDVQDVKVQELQTGDIILVKPGEKIPADGSVTEGSSAVNESMLTGESKPVIKEADDKVMAGSINGNSSIKVKVENTGEDSYLNKVVNMVREAQATKSKTQNLADKAAAWLTYIALSVGVITLAIWLAMGYDFVFALERMATVMVITCPHALGLAIPLVVSISTAVSAQNGLLIRNRTAFEQSRKISMIIFDKTGTLTKGEFGVSEIKPLAENTDENEVLQIAASLEQSSEHPIAAGIYRKAVEKELSLKEVQDFNAITGKGVEGKLDGEKVKVVSPGYLEENDISLPETRSVGDEATVVFVMKGNAVMGYIALADEIREESHDAVKQLQKHGIKVWMATGDNAQVAKAVSEKLGLDGFDAEVLPDEKQTLVKKYQDEGEFVAMTGDGVNDAPALASADVGIAVGSGTDIAAETADIVLVNSNPQDIKNLIFFGESTYNKMIQNMWWATGYNVFAIPLAAGVLYPVGFMLSPAVGAVLMSLSTIIVAINAQFLRNKLKR